MSWVLKTSKGFATRKEALKVAHKIKLKNNFFITKKERKKKVR